MKKFMSFIMAIVMLFSLYACDSKKPEDTMPVETKPAEATHEDLTTALENIEKANDKIITIASNQLDHWNTSSGVASALFLGEEYYADLSYGFNAAEKEINTCRKQAYEYLDTAKALMGTKGTSDYFNAVKEYYKTTKTFLNLVSEFPEGYSERTFTEAVTDCRSNCESAFTEADFYK